MSLTLIACVIGAVWGVLLALIGLHFINRYLVRVERRRHSSNGK